MGGGALQDRPLGALVGVSLRAELVLVGGAWIIAPTAEAAISHPSAPAGAMHNTRALGGLIYTHYIYLFQASGLILLVAMIGAIVLTLRQRVGVRRQSISRQTARTRAESVEVKQVPSRSGVGPCWRSASGTTSRVPRSSLRWGSSASSGTTKKP